MTAWISVIILAHASIDATIRDTDAGDYESNSKKLFGNDDDLQWLRLLRNRLVHVARPDHQASLPAKLLDDVAAFQESFENNARRAMELVYRSIYANPGT